MRRWFFLYWMAALGVTQAWASWPLSPDAGVDDYALSTHWPSDPQYGDQWWLFGFTPSALVPQLSATEAARGVGAAVDRTWSVTRGAPAVVIGMLHSGVLWSDIELAHRWALSRGELPPPQDANGNVSGSADPHDRNGDGRFNPQDFTSASGNELPVPTLVVDPRLAQRADRGDVNQNGLIDPQDLIALFSNGIDDDGNGAVDDICGWDFVWNDNDPLDDWHQGQPSPSPGLRQMHAAVAETDNAVAGAGACPACSVLPIRVATHTTAPPSRLAKAIDFAARQGARVASVGAVGDSQSAGLERALAQAVEAGMFVVSIGSERLSSGDEAPSNFSTVLPVRALGPNHDDWRQATSFWADGKCSAKGAQLGLAVPSPGCGDEALGVAAGVAGLLVSARPDLSPGELYQLLTRHADRQVPWSPSLGYGRLNARAAMDAVVAGKLPASVRVESPGALDVVTGPVEVQATIEARAPFEVFLEAAPGLAPAEEDFRLLRALGGLTQLDDALGQVDPAALGLSPVYPPDHPAPHAWTLRVRVNVLYPDARGAVSSVWRQPQFFHADPDWASGYPLRLAGAGGASPRWVDLDLDGSDELVAVSADGVVNVLDALGQPMTGFPLALGASPWGHPAFGPLSPEGQRDLIVSTSDGRLHVLDHRGQSRPGFPVTLPFPRHPAMEPQVNASPVVVPSPLGPLVFLTAYDGTVHAYRSDGTSAPGFPLTLQDSAPPTPRSPPTTPAAGDLDGDGWPELLVTTESHPDGTCRADLLTLRESGPERPAGWPQVFPGKRCRGSPVMADLDGDGASELVLTTQGAAPSIVDLRGQPVLELTGVWDQGPAHHPSVADLDGDGLLELILSRSEGASHQLFVWAAGKQLKANHGRPPKPAPLLEGFPFPLPEQIPGAHYAIGDVNGDGRPDMLLAAGRTLQAVDAQARVPRGWPRLLGATMSTAPSFGVARGQLVVAAVTHAGLVHAWSVVGFPQNILWDGAHHDPGNTNRAESPLPLRQLPAIGVSQPKIRTTGCCSGAPTGLEAWTALVALAWLSTRRKKADS